MNPEKVTKGPGQGLSKQVENPGLKSTSPNGTYSFQTVLLLQIVSLPLGISPHRSPHSPSLLPDGSSTAQTT